MIKMLVTDIDGTILGKSLKLTPKTIESFRRLKSIGVKTVLATGRMYRATVPIAKELGIDDPLITYQGGFIKEPSLEAKPLRAIFLERDLTLEIADFVKQQNIHLNLYADDTLFVEQKNQIIERYCANVNCTYSLTKDFRNIDFKGVHKLLAIDNDAGKISELTANLLAKYGDRAYITNSTPYYCEISSPKATKGEAVKFLADLWKIKEEEIFAIGDQDNDIELLRNAGIKIAMGNSSEGLKKKADFITDDVDDDGFVKAVEKYILEGEYEY